MAAAATDRDRNSRQFAPAAATDWFRVDVYSSTALVGRITCDRIVAVEPQRGRSAALESFGPGSCQIVIRGGYWFASIADLTTPLPLTVGLTVQAYITDAALAQRGSAGYPRWRRTVPRFVGSITDLGDVEVDPGDPDTLLCPITCTTARARFGNAPAWQLDTHMPVEVVETDTDLDLIMRALDETYALDPMIGCLTAVAASTVDTYPGKPSIGFPTISPPPSATLPLFPMTNLAVGVTEYEGKTINDVITDLEGVTGGVFFESRRGAFRWVIPEERRNAAPPLVIDPSWCREPLTVRQGIGDVINRQRVAFAAPAGAVTEVQDDHSIDQRGHLPGGDLTTRLSIASVVDSDPAILRAADLAAGIVGRYSEPAWTTPAVTVDLTRVLEAGDQDTLFLDLLSLDVASLVQLDALPRRSPADPGVYWVEGMAESITSGRWLLTLSLVPYVLLSPGTRWLDLPTDLTWDELPADLSWIRAYAYNPEPFPAGAWRSVSSDLKWRDLRTDPRTWLDY